MHRIKFSVPSPAGVLSAIALFVALGGTGYAATAVITAKHKAGLNKKQTKQVRKIADTEIGKKAANLTVKNAGTAGTAQHALTADSASSAQTSGHANTATSASNANNANSVGGLTVKKFEYTATTTSTASTPVLSIGGLTLTGRCTSGGGGTVALNATTSTDHTALEAGIEYSTGTDAVNSADFGPLATADLTMGHDEGHTQFTYTKQDGTVVSGQFNFADLAAQSGTEAVLGTTTTPGHVACLASGFVTSTAAS